MATPAQIAAQRAQVAAAQAYVTTSTAYAHTGRAHPLQWTIEREWLAAQAAARAATSWPARAELWRGVERRMQELNTIATDREKRDAAVAVQQEEIAGIQAATVAASPQPPPGPRPAVALLRVLKDRGVTLTVVHGKIVAQPGSLLTAANIEALRSCKAELVPLIRGDVVEV